MISTICTLFEGDYHYGVGALSNSLYRNGFRGHLYAGYRGKLPGWAAGSISVDGYSELAVANGFAIRFVPLTTGIGFWNYKPQFMLSVLRDYCRSADSVFYFDPDIVVLCRWAFFEEWVAGGVALCTDIYSDMLASHPIRLGWLQYFEKYGLKLTQQQDTYFNSGFIGLKKQNLEFLSLWQRLQALMEPALGKSPSVKISDRTFLFHVPDQDALNAATMMCREPLSCADLRGMDFKLGGGYIMSHAIGDAKPWRTKMLWRTLLRSERPTRADKAYFRHTTEPIRLYGKWRLGLKKLDLLAASALGRYLN